ncbi:MAG: cellulose synthase subunit BcsC-related outer membrane protein, partial [Usitatibacter sp.]
MPPAPRGASGAVLEHQESRSGGILYHQESGGLISPMPTAPKRPAPLPPIEPAAPAQSVARKPAAPAQSVARKPAAPTQSVARKPAASAPVAAAPKLRKVPAVAARDPDWVDRLDRAVASDDTAALVALASAPDAVTDCARADRTWSLARALDESGDAAGAERVLDPLLTRCGDAVVRTTTLEIAREMVAPETLARWIARETPAARTGEAEKRFDRLAITLAISSSAAARAPAVERARAMDAEVGAKIVQFRDASAAATLGWLWLEGKDPASASLWFGRAHAWVPEDQDAARGMAYSALQERRFDAALALAQATAFPPEDRRKVLRDAYLGKADAAYRMDRFGETQELLASAASLGSLPRYALEIEAWSFARSGRKAEAAQRFAALYRESPNAASAEGLLASYDNRTMIDAGLAASEPLASMLRAERAVAAFNAGRYYEAAALGPKRYGAVAGVTAPQVGIYAGAGNKTGEEGLSRFHRNTTTSVEGGAVVAEGIALRLRLDRRVIESGRPAATAVLGSAPRTSDSAVEFTDTRANVGEGRIAARLERGLAIDAFIGSADAQAGLARRAIGGVEVQGAPSWGQFAVALAREPVRESVLAYAGMRDPYTGASWGRVTRDALSARMLVLKAAPWTVGASARLARFEGVDVQSNRERNGEVSLGRDLGLPGFAYSAASLSASSDSYERNLGNFTVGHGGYFSPQRYRRLGAALDFMTAHERQWMVRGRVSAGVVSKRVDAAPVLPLAP